MLPLATNDNKSILTPTSGFLQSGFAHTINAKHNFWITKGRDWSLYGAKKNVASSYLAEYDRIKRPRRGSPKPLRIYMSSSSGPNWKSFGRQLRFSILCSEKNEFSFPKSDSTPFEKNFRECSEYPIARFQRRRLRGTCPQIPDACSANQAFVIAKPLIALVMCQGSCDCCSAGRPLLNPRRRCLRSARVF